jgi:hypothetical protein
VGNVPVEPGEVDRPRRSWVDLCQQAGVWRVGFFLSVAAGALFRLIWLPDVEYKGDQIWTFTHVQAYWATHRLSPMGMPSSIGLPNAGMSFWVFIALSAFVPIEDPLALTRAVELLNVVTILLLALFVWKFVDRGEWEPWLWSVALVSVNPYAVLFSRSIWATNLPIFTLGLLVGWWRRSRWWGAFLWGLIGAILGQIHMGGYFFAAAFVLSVLLFDRRSPNWRAWFAGSILGTLPMLPWLMALAEGHQGISASRWYFLAPVFLVHWLSIATGVYLRSSLGKDFGDFVAQPTIVGFRTYVVAALLLTIIVIVLAIAVRFIRRFRADRRQVAAQFFDLRSPTVLALTSALWGYGFLLSLMMRHLHTHYFVIALSLPALSLAWLARAGSVASPKSQATMRLLLSGLVLAQAALTFSFLWYIHDRQIIHGDYGTAYGSQRSATD